MRKIKHSFMIVFSVIALSVSACGTTDDVIQSYDVAYTMPDNNVQNRYYADLGSAGIESKYSFSSAEDLINLSDEDVIYLATHDYKATEFVADLMLEPYDDFGTPLKDGEIYQPLMLSLEGDRADYDVDKKISDEEFKKLAEEWLRSFQENFIDTKIIYYGGTEHYAEYGYMNDGGIGSGRICFFRNRFMVPEKIDGNPYTGPVYFGELTTDVVLMEGDFYHSDFFDGYFLLREVEDRGDAIVYIAYYPSLRNIGDYDERGENHKAEIIKEVTIYDIKTHRITSEITVIRSVDIPGTTLYIPEPV